MLSKIITVIVNNILILSFFVLFDLQNNSYGTSVSSGNNTSKSVALDIAKKKLQCSNYKKLAEEKNIASAAFEVGNCYENALFDYPNSNRKNNIRYAICWYNKAADNGSIYAKNRLNDIIKTIDSNVSYGHKGGGVIINNDTILTSLNIVEQCQRGEKIFIASNTNNSKKIPVRLDLYDRNYDIALLKIENNNDKFSNFINFRDVPLIKKRDKVYLIGYSDDGEFLTEENMVMHPYNEVTILDYQRSDEDAKVKKDVMHSLLLKDDVVNDVTNFMVVDDNGNLVGVEFSKYHNVATSLFNNNDMKGKLVLHLKHIKTFFDENNITYSLIPSKKQSYDINALSDFAKNHGVQIICSN